MVDSLVSIVVEKLNAILQDEVALLVGVTNEVQKISSTFSLIQAVLEDAETRRLTDRAVKIWLEKVKDVAYDVDDILDEWMTDALRSQANDEGDGSCFSNKKVRSFLSPVTCFNHVMFRHKIGSNVKEARGRLDDIEKERNQLGLRQSSEVRRDEISEQETVSVLDRQLIVGREEEKNRILEWLLQEVPVNEVPAVISIVGMGGLGKTVLAQLAYNDERVQGHFEMRMWVRVSDDFDVKGITESIIKSAKTGFNGEKLNLDELQLCLRDMLNAKRFLLVLDDVWNEDSEKWVRLSLPFQVGALGSRIIITTRSETVAFAMGRAHMHRPAVLSNEDCWLSFWRQALAHRSVEERLELEEIAREIVNKCGGLPLAAKTMGSAMRLKRTRREWELVLRSELWNSGDVLGGILPALLPSYYELPPALKQCFTYCSVFPKDWLLEKDTIVKLWVAQGFIGSDRSSDRSRDAEEIGQLYFDDLSRRSLLEVVEVDSGGNILWCKMHDLVHDLAQFIAGSECSTVEIRQWAELDLSQVRHFSLFVSDASIYKAHKLRTLLIKPGIPMGQHLHHLRRLRALHLSRSSIDKLPQTVGQLKYLRYLDLSETWIKELPEEVSNCVNLQTLRLNGCYWLEKLPREMRKMISLRHLELEGASLRYLPQGVGRLTELRTLTDFTMGGGDEGCKCGELKDLNHLQGTLRITGLENITSSHEAAKAELDKKQNLHALSLHYVYIRGEQLDDKMKTEDDVLESLKPYTNLKEFEIWYYRGSKLPRWVEDPVFSNLIKVTLVFCKSCRQLPGLGRLPSLQYLEIVGMEEVRKVGGEFNGDDNNDGSGDVVSFPKLVTLIFFKMPNWEEWELGSGDGMVMPSLLELKIDHCPKLKALPCNLPPLIRKLTLNVSNDGMSSGGPLPVFPDLNHLVISSNCELTSLPCGWLGQLKALQTLEIHDCPELRSLPEELRQLTMLQKLQIVDCPILEKRCRIVNHPLLEKSCQCVDCPLSERRLALEKRCQCMDCPFSESCCKDGGEDRDKIAHIKCIIFGRE